MKVHWLTPRRKPRRPDVRWSADHRLARLRRITVAKAFDLCSCCLGAHTRWIDHWTGERIICGGCYGFGDREHELIVERYGNPWGIEET